MPVFVVTGARAGIGLECVKQVVSNPLNTVVAIVRDLKADISALRAIETESGDRLKIVECDVSLEESIVHAGKSLASVLGQGTQIDVLIHVAAVLHSRDQTSLTVTGDTLLSHMATNVVGPARLTQAVLSILAPGATIANISSGLGSLGMVSARKINASVTAYSISKSALNMLTVHQAQHLEGKAIVVSIDPGHVKTAMGGPDAAIETPESASGIISVLANLKAEHSGKFLLYTGAELPW